LDDGDNVRIFSVFWVATILEHNGGIGDQSFAVKFPHDHTTIFLRSRIYLFHPVEDDCKFRTTAAMIIIFLLAGYALVCLGSGRITYRLLFSKLEPINAVSQITHSAVLFILGQAVLGNLWLILALVGWFNPAIISSTALVCLLFGVNTISDNLTSQLKQLRAIFIDLKKETWSWKTIAFLSIGLCSLWATSLGRSMAGDGASFYMALAKVVATSHRLAPLPGFENFTGIGILGEMHYAALISLGSADAAQLFSWPIIMSSSIVLLAIGRQVGLKRRGQWITLTMVFTSTAVIWLSGDGKTDLFSTALGLAAYYWVTQINDANRQTAIKLTGLFLGFAIVAKISYIPAMISSIAFLFFCAMRSKAPPMATRLALIISSLKVGAQILGWTTIATLPHLIKNLLLFGNPLFPFIPETSAWINQVWYQESTIHRILLTYPLALVFGTYAGQYGNISPLVLAFLPLVLLRPNKLNIYSTKLGQLTFAALLGITVWVLVQPAVFAPRYTLATLLLFFLPTAQAAEFISLQKEKHPLPNLGIIFCMVFTGVMLAATFSNLVFFPSTTARYLSGKLSECGRDPYYCKTLKTVNNISDNGDRIFINIRQRYWLRPDLIQCLLTTTEIETFNKLANAEAQWAYIYERGFKYVVVFTQPENIYPIVTPDIDNIPDWLKITRMNNDKDIILHLESLDSSHRPRITCKETHPNTWQLSMP